MPLPQGSLSLSPMAANREGAEACARLPPPGLDVLRCVERVSCCETGVHGNPEPGCAPALGGASGSITM